MKRLRLFRPGRRRHGFSRSGLIAGLAMAGLVTVLVLWDDGSQASSSPPALQQSTVYQAPPPQTPGAETAFRQHLDKVWITGEGVVVRVLPDDEKGSRHQRFILRLPSGQTLLVAHNIDVSPRIPDLKNGDSVRYYGEYVWNKKGGLVHWTHRKSTTESAGWLERDGVRYE
ncbi:MAG: DUF3465 domain-containing protein [Puniceicoccales bacterium]